MAKKYKKVTKLKGFYASSDFDCFCFDKHQDPEEHYQALEVAYDRWNRGETTEDPDNYNCRVYPSKLLPEGAYDCGDWVITVEFFPRGQEDD